MASHNNNSSVAAHNRGGGAPNSELRRQLEARHLEVLGTDIDNKVCTYWCNAVSEGLKTFHDFEKSLVQSSQYEKRVLSLFKTACFELIGTDGFDAKLFDEFLKFVKTTWARSEKPDGGKQIPVITADIVEAYLRDTKAFRSKYVALIRSVAMLTVETEPDDVTLEHYFQKFRTIRGYNAEALKRDLLNGDKHDTRHSREHDPLLLLGSNGGVARTSDHAKTTTMTSPETTVTSLDQPLPPSHTTPPNSNKRKTAASAASASAASSAVAALEAQTQLQNRDIVTKVNDVLRAFYDVYERPMFVQEYLRFLNAHPRSHPDKRTSVAEWKQVFEEEKPVLLRLINIVNGAYSSFLDADLTEYEIVDKYLPYFDDAAESAETMYESVKKELVHTDAYQRVMSTRIAQAFFETYGTEMAAADVQCVFAKVREQRVSLTDDALYEYIKSFKDEMDVITNNVCETYMAVYERVPDNKELDNHVIEYRARLSSNCTPHRASELNKEVECALISGLEFHDVLKTKLRDRHIAVRQDNMSPATLYGTLALALQRLQSLPLERRTLTEVEAIVRDCIPADSAFACSDAPSSDEDQGGGASVSMRDAKETKTTTSANDPVTEAAADNRGGVQHNREPATPDGGGLDDGSDGVRRGTQARSQNLTSEQEEARKKRSFLGLDDDDDLALS